MNRPRLALPVTIVAEPGRLHLVAGEGLRWTLSLESPRLLADLLGRCDGRTPIESLLQPIPEAERPALLRWLERLRGERVLADGPVELAPPPGRFRPAADGDGPLVERLRDPTSDTPPLYILCQQTLDFHAARRINRQRRQAGTPWLWVSTGPGQRGFVGPVFLPDAGPCLACLLDQFRRISPVPQLYDVLTRHGERGGEFAPVPFPETGLAVLEALARWKVASLSEPAVPLAAYRLHVLELETMEVTAHRVLADPTCAECGRV